MSKEALAAPCGSHATLCRHRVIHKERNILTATLNIMKSPINFYFELTWIEYVRWEDNIKIYLKEIDCEDIDWFQATQDRIVARCCERSYESSGSIRRQNFLNSWVSDEGLFPIESVKIGYRLF
jgi:hypothetical protein